GELKLAHSTSLRPSSRGGLALSRQSLLAIGSIFSCESPVVFRRIDLGHLLWAVRGILPQRSEGEHQVANELSMGFHRTHTVGRIRGRPILLAAITRDDLFAAVVFRNP